MCGYPPFLMRLPCTFPAFPHPRNRTADRVYDTAWKKVDVKKLSWELRYDVQAFFMEHDYLTASTIAKRAGINPGLMRQYSSGIKHPSALQAKKIEAAIHTVAKELKAVSLYAA